LSLATWSTEGLGSAMPAAAPFRGLVACRATGGVADRGLVPFELAAVFPFSVFAATGCLGVAVLSRGLAITGCFTTVGLAAGGFRANRVDPAMDRFVTGFETVRFAVSCFDVVALAAFLTGAPPEAVFPAGARDAALRATALLVLGLARAGFVARLDATLGRATLTRPRAAAAGFRAFARVAFAAGRRVALLRLVEAMASTFGTVET
jgi:hypothetical protein